MEKNLHTYLQFLQMKGIDTGNILKEQKIEILDKDDISSLHKKANELFPKMLLDSIDMVRQNNFGRKQNESIR